MPGESSCHSRFTKMAWHSSHSEPQGDITIISGCYVHLILTGPDSNLWDNSRLSSDGWNMCYGVKYKT